MNVEIIKELEKIIWEFSDESGELAEAGMKEDVIPALRHALFQAENKGFITGCDFRKDAMAEVREKAIEECLEKLPYRELRDAADDIHWNSGFNKAIEEAYEKLQSLKKGNNQ